MSTTHQEKTVQYLHEAHAMELALVRTLQAHVAMTPSGSYRSALESHLRETRGHAERISRRLADLGESPSVVEAGYGAAQRLVAQVLALGKAPLDMLRGASAEEKLLKNAKDECATEALEIATYDALETIARAGGDDLTARLAADHRADEERMLRALRAELPRLTAAVIGSEIHGRPTYDIARTGAAQAARRTARAAQRQVEAARTDATNAARATARDVRRSVEDAADEVADTARRAASSARRAASGAAGDAADALRPSPSTREREQSRQPFAGFDELNADVAVRRLGDLTPAQLRHVETYERAHKRRRTVIEAASAQRRERERVA